MSRGGSDLSSTNAAAAQLPAAGAPQPIDNPPPSVISQGALLPPRLRSNGTLRRLHEAALVRFGERGYHGVSIRELAEAAGVTVSSVYSHVSAKEDLLAELMVVGHLEHNEWMRRAAEAAPEDPASRMRAVVHAHVRVHATYPLLTRVCNKELHALSPANAARVMEVRHDSERLFLEVVEAGVAAELFSCHDPWLAVAAIGGMGIRVSEWFDPRGPYAVDEVADAYAELALRMLCAGPG
ncbi:MAG TPA: TetR/AcrR family transcriptional regulator [Candidatus Dormibacteraeota bacterium]|nr:TetR/AcrR family transcriptional regulator [Candidatus Dormibacteraeota bacterium]